MTSLGRIAAFALLLALPLGAQESKDAPVIKDEAKLFKPETIRTAEAAGRDLAKKGVRLVVETYPTVPPGIDDKAKDMNAKDRAQAFEEWGLYHIKRYGPAAFQIVITNDPKFLEITTGPAIRKKGFTPKDREALTRTMIEKLRNKQIDEAIESALAALRKRFDAPEGASGK